MTLILPPPTARNNDDGRSRAPSYAARIIARRYNVSISLAGIVAELVSKVEARR